jgi:hypothetical protein
MHGKNRLAIRGGRSLEDGGVIAEGKTPLQSALRTARGRRNGTLHSAEDGAHMIVESEIFFRDSEGLAAGETGVLHSTHTMVLIAYLCNKQLHQYIDLRLFEADYFCRFFRQNSV